MERRIKKRTGLLPDLEAGTVYEIDYAALFGRGIRNLLFDIDYTLVPYNAPADERTEALMRRLREMGFSLCFVSSLCFFFSKMPSKITPAHISTTAIAESKSKDLCKNIRHIIQTIAPEAFCIGEEIDNSKYLKPK